MSDGFSRLVKLAALQDHDYAKFQYRAQKIGDFVMLQDAVERRRSATRLGAHKLRSCVNEVVRCTLPSVRRSVQTS